MKLQTPMKRIKHTTNRIIAAAIVGTAVAGAAMMSSALNASPSIPYFPAEFQSMQARTGKLLEGTLKDLRESDEDVVRLQSGFGHGLENLHLLDLNVEARTDVEMPIVLTLSAHLRSSEHGQVKLRLFNFETKRYEEIGQIAVGPTGAELTIEDIPALEFVDEDGRLDISLQQVVTVPQASTEFETEIDWLEVGVY